MSSSSVSAPTDRTISTVGQLQTLYLTQLRQLVKARKTIALLIVQMIPVIGAIFYVLFNDIDGLTMFRNIVEQVTFPFLIPLAAIFYGGPAIVDEMEGRTLTYLTLRPIPKPILYTGKVLAGMTMSFFVVIIPIITLFIVCLVTSNDLGATISSLGQLSIAVALGVATYISIFAALGALFANSLISGIIFFVVFEMIFAFLPILELLSIRYYLRAIAEFNASDRLGTLDKFILDKPIILDWWVGLIVTLFLTGLFMAIGATIFKKRQYLV